MPTLQILTEVFHDVFENDKIVLAPEMTANDVEGWDSLSHSILIAAVELQFNIKFSTRDILRLKNVGDLIRLVDSKLAG
jgi:acyl carrier protein